MDLNYDNSKIHLHNLYYQDEFCECDPQKIDDPKIWSKTPFPMCPKGEIIFEKEIAPNREQLLKDRDHKKANGMQPFIRNVFENW